MRTLESHLGRRSYVRQGAPTTRTPNRTRALAATLTALAALLLVVATLLLLPLTPLVPLGHLAMHLVHLAAAIAAGLTLVRLPRVAPRESLDLLVTAAALGLAFLALGTLALSLAWGPRPSVPWIVDGAALVLGAGRIRHAAERAIASWRRLDLSIVVATRIPLHATLCALALPLLVVPFTPTTAATAAEHLTLPTQAALRGDLRGAVAALPDSALSPSAGLLLHGQLSGGHVGARLFPLTLTVLLALCVALHASRHLGPRSPEWVVTCLVGAPGLLLLTASSPPSMVLMTYGFLAFHEVADWSQHATGGKIALASILAGIAAAEAPRGIAIAVAVLAFLFVAQAVLDRLGFLRQVPGLLGMALLAVVAAAPFLALDAWASPEPGLDALIRRHAPGGERSAPVDIEPTAAPVDWEPPQGQLGAIPAVLAAGPLLLGLLLFLPLVPWTEGLRHALLMGAFAAACWLLPPPYATGAALLPVLACAAGGAAAQFPRDAPGRLAGAFLLVAVPATMLLSLTLGPDVLGGASVVVGRSSEERYVAAHVPDRELIRAVAARAETLDGPVLLVGNLTDCLYPVPVQRTLPFGAGRPTDAQVHAALRAEKTRISLIAVDRDTTPEDSPIPFDELLLIGSYGSKGRFMLYRAEPFRRPR